VAEQPSPADINMAARIMVLNQAVPMMQQIYTASINPATNPVVTIPLKNVGLVRRLWVIVEGTIENTDGAVDAVASPFGISNVISQVNLKDLQSNDRILTGGWHIALVSSFKAQRPHVSALQETVFENAALTLESVAGSYGNNWPVLVNPKKIVHGTSASFRMVYEVPLAYSDENLQGALFLNVVDATAQLLLTINPRPFVASGADDTFAVMKAGTLDYSTNLQFTVYQDYLDQLPQGNDGPVLPMLDLSTVYELKTSTFTAIPTGQDFPVPYGNFRDFLSLTAVYNNSGTDSGHGIGADINYWALKAANFTPLFQLDPRTQTMFTRRLMGVDPPPGTYYFSHRRKPISTLQYGNMQLVLNAITAGAGAYLQIGWEDFALVNTLSQAGSLAAG
jgi:hypothetical protein